LQKSERKKLRMVSDGIMLIFPQNLSSGSSVETCEQIERERETDMKI
jgi:hypothetical protein